MTLFYSRVLLVPLVSAWALPAGAATYLGAADCRIAAVAAAPSSPVP